MTKEEGLKAYEGNDGGNGFVVWLAALSTYASEKQGFTCDIVEVCGADCWWDYYEDGLTPEEALLDDMSCGE